MVLKLCSSFLPDVSKETGMARRSADFDVVRQNRQRSSKDATNSSCSSYSKPATNIRQFEVAAVASPVVSALSVRSSSSFEIHLWKARAHQSSEIVRSFRIAKRSLITAAFSNH